MSRRSGAGLNKLAPKLSAAIHLCNIVGEGSFLLTSQSDPIKRSHELGSSTSISTASGLAGSFVLLYCTSPLQSHCNTTPTRTLTCRLPTALPKRLPWSRSIPHHNKHGFHEEPQYLSPRGYSSQAADGRTV